MCFRGTVTEDSSRRCHVVLRWRQSEAPLRQLQFWRSSRSGGYQRLQGLAEQKRAALLNRNEFRIGTGSVLVFTGLMKFSRSCLLAPQRGGGAEVARFDLRTLLMH